MARAPDPGGIERAAAGVFDLLGLAKGRSHSQPRSKPACRRVRNGVAPARSRETPARSAVSTSSACSVSGPTAGGFYTQVRRVEYCPGADNWSPASTLGDAVGSAGFPMRQSGPGSGSGR